MIYRFALVFLATFTVALTSACSDSPPTSLSSSAKLRFALASELGGFNPVLATSTTDQVLQAQVFEGLVEYVPDNPNFEIRELIADSWEVSNDQKTWVFKLRQDVWFYDPYDAPAWGGRRQVVAKDFVYCWDMVRDSAQANPGAFVFENLKSLRAIDDFTLETVLHNPDSSWLERLASPYAVVFPREAIERSSKRFSDYPVGSAPYYLAEWEHPRRAVFRQIPDWPQSRGPRPEFSSVEFIYVPESTTRSLMFEKGEIDRLAPLQDSFKRFVDGDQPAAHLSEQGIKLIETDTPDLSMLVFNMKDAAVGEVPGDDEGNQRRKLLRQAIASAFPYQQWHTVLRNGVWASPAQHLLPPGLLGADECQAYTWRNEDLTKAKALLVKAGWPEGEGLGPLHLELGSADVASIEMGNMLKSAMQRIGIELQVYPQSRTEFYRKINSGRAQLFTWAWSLDWSDPANLLQLFDSKNFAPGINKANFKNETFDALLQKYLASQLDSQKAELVKQMVAVIGKETPIIPIDHRRSWLLIAPKLDIFSVNPFAPLPCRHFKRK